MKKLDSDTRPLIRHFDADMPLAQARGRIVTAREFVQEAHALAAQLPVAQHVINLCEDRYHFLLGFAAALIRRQVTLLPSSRATHVLTQLGADFDHSYCLSDQALPNGLAGFDIRSVQTTQGNAAASFAIPDIPVEQIAAILFTSGSTGEPTAHAKTWGMWVQGADQLQQAFAPARGSCIIGSIAPQHMFGMESTIMHPLQWGCTIHHARPHLPADIAQAISETRQPVWLMTTPLHLRACAAENQALAGVAGVISSTMPLDPQLAAAAEQLLGCAVHEIYGCTEAGMIAARRSAQQANWRLCADFDIRHDGLSDWLHGPRVARPLALNDRIVRHDAHYFSLQGRLSDMIKIAGKRTTLAALNTALLAIDGVIDGVFYKPDGADDAAHDDQRLRALFVSEQLSAAQVIQALRIRIDPVFMPRPLLKVAALPRDANGKLPRSALCELAEQPQQVPADPGAAPVHGVVPAGHPALAGHFPGNPIVPGLLLLSEIMRSAGAHAKISGVRQVKFHAPLKPDQPYTIHFNQRTMQTLRFSLHREQTLIASGMFELCGASDA